MMKFDDFESRLARIPRREPPESWRIRILGAAPFPESLSSEATANNSFPTGSWWFEQWISWRWVWSGLAAAWLVILGLNGLTQFSQITMTRADLVLSSIPKTHTPTPWPAREIAEGERALNQETRTAQRLLLTELLSEAAPPSVRPKNTQPRPLGPRGQSTNPAFGYNDDLDTSVIIQA